MQALVIALTKKGQALHGPRFDYANWRIPNVREKGEIVCLTHGPFEATFRTHLYSGSGGCPGCRTAQLRADFVTQAVALFGPKFDYSRFVYSSAKDKSIIVCPSHGGFEQTPDKHLQSSHGCPLCANMARASAKKGSAHQTPKAKLSANDYLARFKVKHGDRYELDMSAYEGITRSTVTLICKEHGAAKYTAAALLMSRHACKLCGFAASATAKVKTYSDFVTEATKIHKSAYRYPAANEATYVNRKSWVTITCPTHGEFRKNAQKHLSGQGCWQCKVDELVTTGKLPGGYGPRFFEDNPEACAAPAVLYYLKVGSAYKIGITTQLRNRLKCIKSISGKEVTLLDSIELPLEQAYAHEQSILERFKDFRTYRRWSTEVFSKDVFKGAGLQPTVETA